MTTHEHGVCATTQHTHTHTHTLLTFSCRAHGADQDPEEEPVRHFKAPQQRAQLFPVDGEQEELLCPREEEEDTRGHQGAAEDTRGHQGAAEDTREHQGAAETGCELMYSL